MTKEEILKQALVEVNEPNIHKNVVERWVQFKSEPSTKAILSGMEDYKDQELAHLLEAYHNLKEYYMSDIENLQHIISELIKDHAEVCSSEGLASKSDTIIYWSEKVKYYPSLSGLKED